MGREKFVEDGKAEVALQQKDLEKMTRELQAKIKEVEARGNWLAEQKQVLLEREEQLRKLNANIQVGRGHEAGAVRQQPGKCSDLSLAAHTYPFCIKVAACIKCKPDAMRACGQLPPDPSADAASRSDGAVRSSKERMAEAYREALEQVRPPGSLRALLCVNVENAKRAGRFRPRLPHFTCLRALTAALQRRRAEAARHGRGTGLLFQSARY